MKNTLQTIQNFFLRVTELSKEASGAKIKVEKKKIRVKRISGEATSFPDNICPTLED